jgi:hypothetical protein
MPARISMTMKQRDVLLTLPETENEIVRHYAGCCRSCRDIQ